MAGNNLAGFHDAGAIHRGNEQITPVGVRSFAQAEPHIQKATLRIHESKIKVYNKIGTGSVATVYAGTYENHKVAIKKHTTDQGIMDGKNITISQS